MWTLKISLLCIQRIFLSVVVGYLFDLWIILNLNGMLIALESESKSNEIESWQNAETKTPNWITKKIVCAGVRPNWPSTVEELTLLAQICSNQGRIPQRFWPERETEAGRSPKRSSESGRTGSRAAKTEDELVCREKKAKRNPKDYHQTEIHVWQSEHRTADTSGCLSNTWPPVSAGDLEAEVELELRCLAKVTTDVTWVEHPTLKNALDRGIDLEIPESLTRS